MINFFKNLAKQQNLKGFNKKDACNISTGHLYYKKRARNLNPFHVFMVYFVSDIILQINRNCLPWQQYRR